MNQSRTVSQSSEPVVSSSRTGDSLTWTASGGDVWAALNRLAGDIHPCVNNNNDSTCAVHAEVATYFKQDPMSWWKANEHRFPFLANLAKTYLGPPPSSVQSETIFSIAGEVYDERRRECGETCISEV